MLYYIRKGGGDMKKILLIFISFTLFISLSSCITVKTEIELSQNSENITSIAIYHSENAYYEGDIHTFLEENEPIALIEDEDYSDFLNSLCSLKFEKEKAFFLIPMDGGYDYSGYIVAIVYSEGGYDIVAEGGLYSYAIGKDGQERHKYSHSDYCGEISWTEFIEKYISK